MTDMFSSAAAARQYDRARMRGLLMEAQVAKAQLAAAVDDIVRGYRALLEAPSGISGPSADTKAFVADALKGLRDAASDLDHAENVTIDEAGEWFDPIDLSALDALLERVS